MQLATKANEPIAFPEKTKVAIRVDYGSNDVKQSIYAYDKYNAQGDLDNTPGAPLRWAPFDKANEIFFNGVKASLVAFAPANYFDGKTPTNDEIIVGASWFNNVTDYNDANNPDICVAKATGLYSGLNSIDLVLEHRMASLVFVITKASNFSTPQGKITSFNFQGFGFAAQRKLNVKTFEWGEWVTSDYMNSFKFDNTDFQLANGTTTLNMLVPPSYYDAYAQGQTPGNFDIIFVLDGKNYKASIPFSEKFKRINQNTRYKFLVELTPTGAQINSVTQTPWTNVDINDGVALTPEIVTPAS